MPILPTDIKVFLSGGSTNTDPDNSTGGDISTTEVNMSDILHNLFDKITGDESAAGNTEYRVIYIRNTSLINGERCKAYFTANHRDQITMAVNEARNVTAQSSPGLTFLNPNSRATALILGDLGANDYRALHLKRTVTPDSPAEDDAEFDIQVEIDTPE